MAFGKPGRPREDRLLRQRAIFEAVAPLILERGARRVTMRDAARAAYVSVGALYHYFPRKRDLLLHPLSEQALDRFCLDFLKGSFGLRTEDPRGFLDVYAEFCAASCLFVRPAAQAALDLGSETFWPVIDASMQAGLDNFLDALRHVAPELDESETLALARSVRRVLLAGLFDRSMTPDDIRTGVRALVEVAVARSRYSVDDLDARQAGETPTTLGTAAALRASP